MSDDKWDSDRAIILKATRILNGRNKRNSETYLRPIKSKISIKKEERIFSNNYTTVASLVGNVSEDSQVSAAASKSLSWTLRDLSFKYRDVQIRSKIWEEWQQLNESSNRCFVNDKIVVPTTAFDRHPIDRLFNTYLNSENKLFLSLTKWKNRVIQANVALEEMWTMNLQHFQEFRTIDGANDSNAPLFPSSYRELSNRRDTNAIKRMNNQIQSVSYDRSVAGRLKYSRACHDFSDDRNIGGCLSSLSEQKANSSSKFELDLPRYPRTQKIKLQLPTIERLLISFKILGTIGLFVSIDRLHPSVDYNVRHFDMLYRLTVTRASDASVFHSVLEESVLKRIIDNQLREVAHSANESIWTLTRSASIEVCGESRQCAISVEVRKYPSVNIVRATISVTLPSGERLTKDVCLSDFEGFGDRFILTNDAGEIIEEVDKLVNMLKIQTIDRQFVLSVDDGSKNPSKRFLSATDAKILAYYVAQFIQLSSDHRVVLRDITGGLVDCEGETAAYTALESTGAWEDIVDQDRSIAIRINGPLATSLVSGWVEQSYEDEKSEPSKDAMHGAMCIARDMSEAVKVRFTTFLDFQRTLRPSTAIENDTESPESREEEPLSEDIPENCQSPIKITAETFESLFEQQLLQGISIRKIQGSENILGKTRTIPYPCKLEKLHVNPANTTHCTEISRLEQSVTRSTCLDNGRLVIDVPRPQKPEILSSSEIGCGVIEFADLDNGIPIRERYSTLSQSALVDSLPKLRYPTRDFNTYESSNCPETIDYAVEFIRSIPNPPILDVDYKLSSSDNVENDSTMVD